MLADTHVLVWLYAGQVERFPEIVRERLEREEMVASPIVRLELEYLHEIGRVSVPSRTVLAALERTLGVTERDHPLGDLVDRAIPLTWTRDPFDRLLAAHATAADLPLITKDQTLRSNLSLAAWD